MKAVYCISIQPWMDVLQIIPESQQLKLALHDTQGLIYNTKNKVNMIGPWLCEKAGGLAGVSEWDWAAPYTVPCQITTLPQTHRNELVRSTSPQDRIYGFMPMGIVSHGCYQCSICPTHLMQLGDRNAIGILV